MRQIDLANAINVSKAAISSWESGHALPSLDNAVLLRDFLNVTLDYLLGRSASPQEIYISKKL